MPAAVLEVDFSQQIELNEHLFRHLELHDTLIRAVLERTNRTIVDLRINISKSEIVLWGHTRAYYYKQLASQAILAELTGIPVVNEIQVL